MRVLLITPNDYEDRGEEGVCLLPHKAKEFIDGGYTHVRDGDLLRNADYSVSDGCVWIWYAVLEL